MGDAPAGRPTIVINPPYEQDVYPATTLTAPQESYTASADGTVSVQPSLALTGAAAVNTAAISTVGRYTCWPARCGCARFAAAGCSSD